MSPQVRHSEMLGLLFPNCQVRVVGFHVSCPASSFSFLLLIRTLSASSRKCHKDDRLNARIECQNMTPYIYIYIYFIYIYIYILLCISIYIYIFEYIFIYCIYIHLDDISATVTKRKCQGGDLSM